jgi:hypothetical protein
MTDIVAGHGDWFTAKLLRLCACAGRTNLERIREAFPDEVEAYEAWMESPMRGGTDGTS